MKKLLALSCAALLLSACTQKSTSTDNMVEETTTRTPVASAMSKPSNSPQDNSIDMTKAVDYKFKLAALSTPKREGSVTLREDAGRVKVMIELSDDKKLSSPAATSASASAYPAHIHLGSCPTPGDVKYPLTEVVNGKSETTLPAGVTIKYLMGLGKLSVNVHKSSTDMKTYISCGNLDFTSGAEVIDDKMSSGSGSTKSTPTMSPQNTAKPSAAASAQ